MPLICKLLQAYRFIEIQKASLLMGKSIFRLAIKMQLNLKIPSEGRANANEL